MSSKLLILVIIGIFTIAVIGWVSQHHRIPLQESPLGEDLDWARTDPLALLELLKSRPGTPLTIASTPPPDWITEEHVRQLMQVIDSKEPAAPVVSVLSSYYPFNESSTVGNEAMFLIEGFRRGRYPPALCSIYYFDGNPDELRTWWGNGTKVQLSNADTAAHALLVIALAFQNIALMIKEAIKPAFCQKSILEMCEVCCGNIKRTLMTYCKQSVRLSDILIIFSLTKVELSKLIFWER